MVRLLLGISLNAFRLTELEDDVFQSWRGIGLWRKKNTSHLVREEKSTKASYLRASEAQCVVCGSPLVTFKCLHPISRLCPTWVKALKPMLLWAFGVGLNVTCISDRLSLICHWLQCRGRQEKLITKDTLEQVIFKCCTGSRNDRTVAFTHLPSVPNDILLSLSDQTVEDKARLFINDQGLLSCFLPRNRATHSSHLQRGPVGVKTQQWRHTPTRLLQLNTDTTTLPATLLSAQPGSPLQINSGCFEQEGCT